MQQDIDKWETEFSEVLDRFMEAAELKPGMLMVVGCSTSEVAGERIGTAGTTEVAEMLFRQLDRLRSRSGITLAFQCCEHLNRALVIGRKDAEERKLEEVSVIPVRNAGGAMASYAFAKLPDAIVVESVKAEAGIDIGDTLIGMHLKPVAVPVRVGRRTVGHANVVLAKTRPKLIGGSRAVYERNPENLSCR